MALNEAVRRHDLIFREEAPSANGFIVETGREGDSVLVAFAKATDAVSCALALQLRLLNLTRRIKGGLSVRIALHTGEAEFRDGHFYGQPINRCARLLATGYGGQVLLTSATRDLVVGLLPEGCSLGDLGRHRLRDLSEAEHVFQLVHPNLRSVFPALKSLESPLANLPAQLTSFVGREDALAALKQKLLTTRLLTLTGPGGSGKTRLAVQLATELIDDFPGGMWFVDLVPLSDPALVSQKVISALGLREQPDRSAQETVAGFLNTKRALLLLDNCEHLIDAVASFADGLLRATSELVLLATSREVLRVSGEAVWPVPPLSIPPGEQVGDSADLGQWDAIRLFTERAASSLPTFSLTMENAGTVATICRQLDGLPLAIELAATRIATMSPAQFLARLGDRLKLLSKGSRLASPKQQTLEATFDWSYELLDGRERTLFPRLGVFSSSFTLEEVEAVCAGDGITADDVVDLIGQLTGKSLVVVEYLHRSDVRYRLLETVRRYAWSRILERGEDQAMQQRLADFCFSIAEQAGEHAHSAEGPAWMDVVDEQGDNMRLVLGWCRLSDPAGGLQLSSNLAEYWDLRGRLTEGRMWLTTFLDLNQTGDRKRAEALAGAGLLAWRQGDNPTARRHYEECLSIGRSTKNDALTGRALRGIADALFGLGEYHQAEILCAESVAVFRAIDDTAEIAQTLSRLGNTILIQGKVTESIPLYEESIALYRRLGDRVGIANQLWSVGAAETIGGQHAAACLHLEECLAIRREIRDELGIPYALLMLSYANTRLGNFTEARAQHRVALPKVLELGDRWGISIALDFLTGLAISEGRLVEGVRLSAASEAVRSSIGAHQLAWIRDVVDGWLADARRGLKALEADRAYRDGRQMTPEDSVEHALAFLSDSGPKSDAPVAELHDALSRRELQVARLVTEGHTNREIAQILFISERTVDNHVKHIFDKLQFRSRAQIGAWLLTHPEK